MVLSYCSIASTNCHENVVETSEKARNLYNSTNYIPITCINRPGLRPGSILTIWEEGKRPIFVIAPQVCPGRMLSMGEAEYNTTDKTITIHSHLITYGGASNEALTELIAEEIGRMWNEPAATIQYGRHVLQVRFAITAAWQPGINPDEIIMNTNPRNNYFRIENYAHGNISFVDEIGCNTGYFLLENLYAGSTTAAHEYGHTLGLVHPANLDIRGQGVPGIMYPRGTLVDAAYQYEPHKPAGVKGGTLHPIHRKVFASDIAALKLQRLRFNHDNKAVVGDFTNVYHLNHAENDFMV